MELSLVLLHRTMENLVILTKCAVPEKNPYLPHGRSLELPRGRGVLGVKILEAKYEAKLEFHRGRGVQHK